MSRSLTSLRSGWVHRQAALVNTVDDFTVRAYTAPSLLLIIWFCKQRADLEYRGRVQCEVLRLSRLLYIKSSASTCPMIFDERWAIYTYFAVCFWSGRSSKSTFSNEITVIIYCWALLALTFLHGMLIHVLFVVFYTLLVDGYSASLHRIINFFSRCIVFVHWWIFILCA